MTTFPTHARRPAALLVLTGLLAIVGCADDGLDKRYPVSGTVTYLGKPLEKGSITFTPTNPDGRGAVGEIKNGSYVLTTQTDGDGAFPGSYSVTIQDLNVDFSKAEADTKKAAEKANVAPTAMLDQVAVASAVNSAKSNIPAKYGQIDSSGLKAEVKSESNKFDFDLKD